MLKKSWHNLLSPGLVDVVDFYSDDIPHAAMLPMEFRMWVLKWNLRLVIFQISLLIELVILCFFSKHSSSSSASSNNSSHFMCV